MPRLWDQNYPVEEKPKKIMKQNFQSSKHKGMKLIKKNQSGKRLKN
jgi:hypothetical protein